MSSELAEIETFIGQVPPFDLLDQYSVEQLVKHLEILYVRAGEPLPPESVTKPSLFIIRKGLLAYFDNDNSLIDKYGEQDLCTVFAFANDKLDVKVRAEEDCILYCFALADILPVIETQQSVVDFLQQSAAQRLQVKVNQLAQEDVINASLSNARLEQFYQAGVETITASASIQAAAIKMTEKGFSSLVVEDVGKPVGIITDKDLRSRCIAKGVDIQAPIANIMTTAIKTIDCKASAYDALLLMNACRIHHLPVTKSGQLDGMISITDLMHYEGQNAVNITHMIRKAKTVEALEEIATLIPKLQLRMSKIGTTALNISKSISAICQSLTQRMIELAMLEIGQAPCNFAWLAAGSQARKEQYAHSDQDNALIISDEATERDMQWFTKLAEFVCHGLNQCGFVYCPGNVMAMNSTWRQKQTVWHKYFSQWIDTPEPKALMHSSIFFDLTTVYGDESLLEEVRAKMLEKSQRNTLFIAHLTKNALQLKPPLGMFRDFVLKQNGKNKKTFDIKHQGIAPIVDLARIYALSHGVEAVSTIERLEQCAGSKVLTKSSAANLIDAFQLLHQLKLQHQVMQQLEGESVDNDISPKEISRLERAHVKDAFKVIKTLQDNRQSVY
ncbi:cyclic nucleotide-binding/CBS domain-containing protein [Thalassotalea sp. LPB0316]|uniref:putative nucleotidyltransferase substrate binding domain-containing protein n=1 Tax=Thalassotalea sp. LPB0316 TaxID=2769490 RepID=UPI0018693048|nr:putative nucleotidyltransferase substrate binding domain-containing protein [Thalassotalea sp. LPB0316]QOL25107.1 cyclic nucleotide-binding/CBS domain-containing protein [Thalassotalea sp. LPB0316]